METLERKTVSLRLSICLVLLTTAILLAESTFDRRDEVTVPYYNEASFTPLWNMDQISSAKLHKIAAFRTTNQSGKPVTQEDLKDKITLVNFFFTSCQSVCPKMKNTMNKVQASFDGNLKVSFLSYSVAPESDDVGKLSEYARINNIPTKQWNLVTGDKSKIYDLARKSYFIEEEPGLSRSTKQFLHTENLVLIDGEGHIRGLYNGTLEAEVPRITADIKGLLDAL